MFSPAIHKSRNDIPNSFIPISDGALLCADSGEWTPIEGSAWRFLSPEPEATRHYLGQFHSKNCYVVDITGQPHINGYSWQSLRSIMGVISETDYEVASRSLQIITWDKDHRYCGRCGAITTLHAEDRAKSCEPCGLIHYPKQSPCIITIITREDELLLARNANFPQPYFSALSGFIDAGESIEAALRREVNEEVSIEVGDLHYFSSQSWPFPGQLMIGFHADYTSGEIQVDGKEIVEANWYRYDQLPMVPPVHTLSGQLIRSFVEGFRNR